MFFGAKALLKGEKDREALPYRFLNRFSVYDKTTHIRENHKHRGVKILLFECVLLTYFTLQNKKCDM